MAKCEDSMLRTGKNLSKSTSFPQRKNYFKENLVGRILRLSSFEGKSLGLSGTLGFLFPVIGFLNYIQYGEKKKKKKSEVNSEFLCAREKAFKV